MNSALPLGEVGRLNVLPVVIAGNVAAELDEATRRYRFLANTVPLIIWTSRPDGGVDYYNKAWFDYTGLTLAQTEDWGWGAVIHPDDLQQCIQCWTHSLTTGENYEIEYRFKRGPGETYRWFLGRAKAQRNEQGEIVQWIGTCTDIDDQKRARSELEIRVAERTAELAKSNDGLRVENAERERTATALMEATRFLQSTLDALSAHIAILDEHGTIIAVNRAWNRFAGDNDFTGEARGVGDNYMQICESATGEHSQEAPVVVSGIRAVMSGEREEFHLEYPCHGPQEQRWFMLRVTRFGGPGLARVVVAHENITERKRAEEELRKKEYLLSEAQRLGHVGSFHYDISGPMSWSTEAYRIFGVSPDTFTPGVESLIALIHPDDRQSTREWIAACVGGEKPGELNFRVNLPDGSIRFIRGRGEGVFDAENRVAYIAGTAEDITERKRIEAQLSQSQKMETVGILAGGIAHEFNSILTAIIGQSEILLSDLPRGNPLYKNATEIRKAADRAAVLTHKLLAYGRKQTLQPAILELNSILTAIEKPIRGLIGRCIDLRITLAAGLKPAKADAENIEEVVINLVMNAVDAMPNSGKLTLETANVTLDQEYVSRFPELQAGEYAMLAITDTGTGMSENVKAHVFEPFFTTKGVGQGTGLGLSTCYGIIKQSGGHISVYSELGRGTTFKIYLPQVESQTKIAVKRTDLSSLPLGTETILLVEDDPSLREAAATLLIRLGYTVVAAANGIEALSMHPQRDIGRFDLLFTDFAMPQMSGRELAEKMQSLHPRIRILYTSAFTENAISHQGTLEKGVALLQKPFTPSALANKIREVLDRPQA